MKIILTTDIIINANNKRIAPVQLQPGGDVLQREGDEGGGQATQAVADEGRQRALRQAQVAVPQQLLGAQLDGGVQRAAVVLREGLTDRIICGQRLLHEARHHARHRPARSNHSKQIIRKHNGV